MLYKFKSRATGDLIMLQAHGRRLLDIIGKDSGPDGRDPGILLPGQMEAAIAAIEAAIARDEATERESPAERLSTDDAAELHEKIRLRQRAQPFIEMLRRCRKADCDVVWGV